MNGASSSVNPDLKRGTEGQGEGRKEWRWAFCWTRHIGEGTIFKSADVVDKGARSSSVDHGQGQEVVASRDVQERQPKHYLDIILQAISFIDQQNQKLGESSSSSSINHNFMSPEASGPVLLTSHDKPVAPLVGQEVGKSSRPPGPPKRGRKGRMKSQEEGPSSADGSRQPRKKREGNSWTPPPGWTVEERTRVNGKSKGNKDKYYRSPEGRVCRSKPDVLRHVQRKLRE